MSSGPASSTVSTSQPAISPSDEASSANASASSARLFDSTRRIQPSASPTDAWHDPITSAPCEPRNEHRPPRRQQSNPADLMNFRVDLDLFRGPLDLLLYLVRKHEVNLIDIPIAPITEQFIDFITVLEELDVNAVGDFLEMASMLVEIKSKLLLPKVEDEEAESDWEDPRDELVEQLLAYKKYRDAACILEDRNRHWSQRYVRLANDLPPRKIKPSEQPIREVELWDLVSAMGRVIRARNVAQGTSIVYDDTPIQVYMERIHAKLIEDGQVAFTDMFEISMHKSAMIGVFLAVLELVRHHCVFADQDGVHGEIYLKCGSGFSNSLDLSDVDDYAGAAAAKPR